MKWRIGWVHLATLLTAHAAQAQSVGYEEALRAAQVDQPVLQARELQVEARRETAGAAAELPDPRLRAGIANLPISGPAAFQLDRQLPSQVSIGIEQEIPNLAKRHARTSFAQSDISLADARLLNAARMVQIATGQAWVSLAYAQRRLSVASAAQGELRKLVPVARSAVASGSARPAESLEIRRAVLVIDDMATRIDAERETAEARLARYIGGGDLVAVGEVPSAEIDVQRLRETLGQNPELILAGAGVQRARAAAALAEAEKRPDFGVNVSYGRRDPMFGDVVSVMGSVTLPIFSGRRQQPRIRAAQAEEAAASAEREDRLREIKAQFEAQLAAWRSSSVQWRRAREELLPLARDRADLEIASFAAGRADLLDVIEAKTALVLLELEILEREEATVEAAAKLRLTYREDLL